MKIFVTGASGWIGSAVVPELLQAGHQVTGLARSDASAEALAKAGAEAERGTIDDLDLLAKAAAAADGVIHLAFKHDIAFTGDFEGAATADRTAVDTFGDALAGSGKPFVIASGLLGLAPGRVATEKDGLTPPPSVPGHEGPSARLRTAQATLAPADRGVRSSVLRLPPTVHGDGDNGFMAALVGMARQKGNAAYVGDGASRRPAGAPPSSLASSWACRSCPSRRRTRASASASWAGSSPWTARPPGRSPRNCWTGSPPTRAWSRTWSRGTSSGPELLAARP